jgi:hypothetical protein
VFQRKSIARCARADPMAQRDRASVAPQESVFKPVHAGWRKKRAKTKFWSSDSMRSDRKRPSGIAQEPVTWRGGVKPSANEEIDGGKEI